MAVIVHGTRTKERTMKPRESDWLERGSSEWEYAWGKIEEAYGDTNCRHDPTGETWQYMGTWKKDGTWVHQFRHRALPGDPPVPEIETSRKPNGGDSSRVYADVPASDRYETVLAMLTT